MTTRRPQVAIAGAGLAGMSLALELAQRGLGVTLLERRSHPGGAVHTVCGPHGEMDNSVHLFLAAFQRCQALLERIGSRHELLALAPRARVLVDRGLVTLPMGQSVLGALKALPALGLGRSWDLTRSLRILLGAPTPAVGQVASQWLEQLGLRPTTFAFTFWREWAISVFNTPLEALDAGLACRTICQLFRYPRQQAPLVAARNLHHLWTGPLERALRQAGVACHWACGVKGLEHDGRHVRALLTRDLRVEADAFIWAGPPDALARLDGAGDLASHLPSRRHGRHIVNVRLKVDGAPSPTAGLHGWFGEPLQWLFPSATGEVTLVGSAWTDNEVARRAQVEAEVPRLLAAYGIQARGAAQWLVQRHATPLQDPAHEAARPSPTTNLDNFWLSGAWLNTGLPASMEGALAGAELTLQAMRGNSALFE